MAYTISDLRTLQTAIASGTKIVQYENSRVEYQSLNEMRQAETNIMRQLGLVSPHKAGIFGGRRAVMQPTDGLEYTGDSDDQTYKTQAQQSQPDFTTDGDGIVIDPNLTNQVNQNTTNISQNTSNIATNVTNISTVQTEVTNLDVEISQNATSITGIQTTLANKVDLNLLNVPTTLSNSQKNTFKQKLSIQDPQGTTQLTAYAGEWAIGEEYPRGLYVTQAGTTNKIYLRYGDGTGDGGRPSENFAQWVELPVEGANGAIIEELVNLNQDQTALETLYNDNVSGKVVLFARNLYLLTRHIVDFHNSNFEYVNIITTGEFKTAYPNAERELQSGGSGIHYAGVTHNTTPVLNNTSTTNVWADSGTSNWYRKPPNSFVRSITNDLLRTAGINFQGFVSSRSVANNIASSLDDAFVWGSKLRKVNAFDSSPEYEYVWQKFSLISNSTQIVAGIDDVLGDSWNDKVALKTSGGLEKDSTTKGIGIKEKGVTSDMLANNARSYNGAWAITKNYLKGHIVSVGTGASTKFYVLKTANILGGSSPDTTGQDVAGHWEEIGDGRLLATLNSAVSDLQGSSLNKNLSNIDETLTASEIIVAKRKIDISIIADYVQSQIGGYKIGDIVKTSSPNQVWLCIRNHTVVREPAADSIHWSELIGGSPTFLNLTDTPADFTSATALQALRLNSAKTALEFFTIPAGQGGASTFVELTDTPADFTSATALQALRLNSAKTALEFFTIPAGQGGASTFVELTDTPADFTSATALQPLRLNSGKTALEFFTPDSGISTFVGLDDTPANFTSATALQALRLNSGKTSLEFFTVPDSGASTFIALTDTPNNFTSATALQALRLNSGKTALEFFTPDSGISTFVGLNDTPADFTSATALQALRLNSGKTALEFFTPSTPDSGSSTFVELTDTPAAFGTAGQIATVNDAEDALEFTDSFEPGLDEDLTRVEEVLGLVHTGDRFIPSESYRPDIGHDYMTGFNDKYFITVSGNVYQRGVDSTGIVTLIGDFAQTDDVDQSAGNKVTFNGLQEVVHENEAYLITSFSVHQNPPADALDTALVQGNIHFKVVKVLNDAFVGTPARSTSLAGPIITVKQHKERYKFLSGFSIIRAGDVSDANKIYIALIYPTKTSSTDSKYQWAIPNVTIGTTFSFTNATSVNDFTNDISVSPDEFRISAADFPVRPTDAAYNDVVVVGSTRNTDGDFVRIETRPFETDGSTTFQTPTNYIDDSVWEFHSSSIVPTQYQIVTGLRVFGVDLTKDLSTVEISIPAVLQDMNALFEGVIFTFYERVNVLSILGHVQDRISTLETTLAESGVGENAISDFTDLGDTPDALGTANQLVSVTSSGDALEFVDKPTASLVDIGLAAALPTFTINNFANLGVDVAGLLALTSANDLDDLIISVRITTSADTTGNQRSAELLVIPIYDWKAMISVAVGRHVNLSGSTTTGERRFMKIPRTNHITQASTVSVARKADNGILLATNDLANGVIHSVVVKLRKY